MFAAVSFLSCIVFSCFCAAGFVCLLFLFAALLFDSFTAGFTAVFSFSTTAFSCTLAVVFSFDSGASLEEEVG